MARFEVKALDEYVDLLSSMSEKQSKEIIEEAIYEGAGIIADEIKSEIEGLKTGKSAHNGVTEDEKKDLIEGFGIAPMQYKNGAHDVKIGFDGYGSKPTRKYPKGVPIPLTARSIISGTSFRPKNNFVRRAVNRKKKKAIERMDEVINERFKKEMK